MSTPVLASDIATLAAASAAVVGAITFIFKVRQDHVTFRHKQADSARLLVTAVYESKQSLNALNMLDYSAFHYVNESGDRCYLTKDDVLHGLRASVKDDLTPNDVFVRDAFDALFLRLEQIWGLLRVRYIQWSDIEATIGYYVDVVRKDIELQPAVVGYAQLFGFPGVALIFQDAMTYRVSAFRGATAIASENR